MPQKCQQILGSSLHSPCTQLNKKISSLFWKNLAYTEDEGWLRQIEGEKKNTINCMDAKIEELMFKKIITKKKINS